MQAARWHEAMVRNLYRGRFTAVKASPVCCSSKPILSELTARRVRTWVYGLLSAVLLCDLVLTSAVATAQDTAPRYWDRRTAETLLVYIERIGSHGLDPGDYGDVALSQAIASGDPDVIERQATESFATVAADLAIGHVRPGKRGRYYIQSDLLDLAKGAQLIDVAIAAGDVAPVLDGLAPRDPQYAVLRGALVRLGPEDNEKRRKLKVTLERWRWLPRDLGTRFLLVNIPDYRVQLFERGVQTASHRVIVGKVSTPTPQISATVTGIIFNPSWHVPQSIVAESVGSLVRRNPSVARSRGYTWTWDRFGKLQVTQQPGPQNALGQMKLDMPNAFAIYLHDTPSKELFDRDSRTFSHGCIRTDMPFDLAAKLLGDPEWTRASIDAVVAEGQTRRVALNAPVPVYAVYLTAVADADGTVRYLDDPYRLDAAIDARLNDAS